MKTDWTDRQERTSRDYGPPEQQWKSWEEYKAWWKERFGETYEAHEAMRMDDMRNDLIY